MPDNEETTKITEALYEQNLELVSKNKTLALLGKLYDKSISVLTPAMMAQQILDTILEDLNLEFTGIFNFKKKTDTLTPLAFSKSTRLVETLNSLGFLFMDIKITDVSKKTFLQNIVYEKKNNMTDKLEEIWGELIKPEDLEKIRTESHIKTILLYPLLTGENVFQVLVLGMNRDFESLNTFEKSSITSFTNVITLSLNKAYIYRDLQDTNVNLENLIKQRESLVHLITHKVKGSFTHSKYIFAEMINGTFGPITPELKTMAEKGLESDNTGIETVDLVLNAANLTKGTIKYDMRIINFKEIVQKTITEKTGSLESKGLKIENTIQDGNYNVFGDAFWLKEVINNLIENAIKYTKQGTITVGLTDGDGKVKLFVKDTGMGITDEDKKNLFTEGGRGKDSIKVNVDSTGYGLYSVKLIIETHKGKVWAESEGPNKGSTFFVELPAVP